MPQQTAELSGTPKQIAWAESIRAEALAAVEAKVNEYREKQVAGTLAMYERALDYLQRQTDAGFWIDNRGYDYAYFLNLGTKRPYIALITTRATK